MDQTQKSPPMRQCVVTGESFPRAELLRFMRAPDGRVVFDRKANLPGRGVWLQPKQALLEEAIRKKHFARGFKQQVTAAEDLPQQVAIALKKHAISLLQRGVANRSLLQGFEKVSSALQGGEVKVLIHAQDAAEDGCQKLDKWAQSQQLPILNCFSRDELADGLHIANPVHLALCDASLSQAFVHAVQVWGGFIDNDAL